MLQRLNRTLHQHRLLSNQPGVWRDLLPTRLYLQCKQPVRGGSRPVNPARRYVSASTRPSKTVATEISSVAVTELVAAAPASRIIYAAKLWVASLIGIASGR